jgi:predicted Zn-ribbon and HTH transcriptional regulator
MDKPDGNNDTENKGVVEKPLRCPHCGSTNVIIYHTGKLVRYRQCRECGWRFKSVRTD